jgi:hypothetical protein
MRRALTFEQVHYIRTSPLSTKALAAEFGLSAWTVRRARHGLRGAWLSHPTPPKKLPRGGWKKPQPPAPFESEKFSLPGEEWRPVVGWEKYYRVSNMGRVYSLHQTGRLCIGMPMEHGYRVVKVRDKERRGHLQVHCMVLEAFVGPRPEPKDVHEACHNDGNPRNCRLDNLRWDTRLGNAADRVKHGTSLRGRRIARKLTADIVRQIRSGSRTDMYWAKRLQMTRLAIQSARTGKTWKEVDAPPLRKRP